MAWIVLHQKNHTRGGIYVLRGARNGTLRVEIAGMIADDHHGIVLTWSLAP